MRFLVPALIAALLVTPAIGSAQFAAGAGGSPIFVGSVAQDGSVVSAELVESFAPDSLYDFPPGQFSIGESLDGSDVYDVGGFHFGGGSGSAGGGSGGSSPSAGGTGGGGGSLPSGAGFNADAGYVFEGDASLDASRVPPGTAAVVATPEPASVVLLGSGLAFVFGAARRRRRNAVAGRGP